MISRILATTGIIILLSPERSLHIVLLHALCWAHWSSITAKNIYRRWKGLAIIYLNIAWAFTGLCGVILFSLIESVVSEDKHWLRILLQFVNVFCFSSSSIAGAYFRWVQCIPAGLYILWGCAYKVLAWMERVQEKPNCWARWLRYGGSGASRSGISGVYYALVSYSLSWITGLMNCLGWGLKGIKLDSKFT